MGKLLFCVHPTEGTVGKKLMLLGVSQRTAMAWGVAMAKH